MCVQKRNKCIWREPLELQRGRVHFDMPDISDLLGGFPRAESDCMKLGSLGWDVLDQYQLVLANHEADIQSNWKGEQVGRVAIA